MNLYQLNIKYKKVHPIKSQYIYLEKVNKNKLNSALFVINTGGNHIPLKRQLKIQKRVMKHKFSIPIKYENINKSQNNNDFIINLLLCIFKIFATFILIKFYFLIKSIKDLYILLY